MKLATLMLFAATLAAGIGIGGCQTLDELTDRRVDHLIRARQEATLEIQAPPRIAPPDVQPRPGRRALAYVPRPTTADVPPAFATPTTQPAPVTIPRLTAAKPPDAARPDPNDLIDPNDPNADLPLGPGDVPLDPADLAAPATVDPDYARQAAEPAADALAETTVTPRRSKLFTLTESLAYAQRHRREFQAAQEDLYLVALALTLERHLWTPIFASNLRTVYGNYGEAQNFDQAMRFVADLAVSQRLPYGGEFTATALSRLVRDVGKSITAEEGGELKFEVDIPLLRGAGHVAREELIQLERDLTYAVREFERFRRRQLVTVARSYFDLLRVKQRVIDSEESLNRAKTDYERAWLMEELPGEGRKLDTLRAQQRMLNAERALWNARENFRSQADQFKLTIGMPVDEPLGLEDLEDIESIEEKVIAGVYPLLRPSPAVRDQQRAVAVALERRYDLLNARDQVDDARRGVAVARNGMLPDLNWVSSLSFDTDPEHYGVGAYHFDRANWRSELILELPLERTAERNALRRSMISVRAAQRNLQDSAEQVRAEVREAVNQYRLQEISVDIQRENLFVAQRRAEYAELKFKEGDISNRDKIEAETELLDALNLFNLAKTSRWVALLQFRLATETLQVDDDGQQRPTPAIDEPVR